MHAGPVHTRFVALSLAAWLASASAWADDWNQFRGPRGDGTADVQLPVEWAADRNIAWKVKIPGLGWSQPVAAGDRIFLTTAVTDEQPKPDPNNRGPGFEGFAGFLRSGGLNPPDVHYRWVTLCLDASTGERLWEKVAREGRPTMQVHANNTYATETPVTDGERVIAYFGMTGVYCFDLEGELLWSKDLGAYPMQFGWGTGSSPIIWDNLIYIQCDNDQASYVVALDKTTGDEAWRIPRDERSNWSTPYIWKNALRTELVAAGGNRMRSYDPKTGALLWEMAGNGRTAITPVGDEELLYVESGDRLTGNLGFIAAIRAGASGEIVPEADEGDDRHVAWTLQGHGSSVASPMLCEGCLYLLDNQGGVVRCLDAKTGAEHYRKRLPGATGFTASPIGSAGRVYLLDQNGQMFVIAAGPKLNVLAANKLDQMCWGSPSVAGERLLIRTAEELFAIDEE